MLYLVIKLLSMESSVLYYVGELGMKDVFSW